MSAQLVTITLVEIFLDILIFGSVLFPQNIFGQEFSESWRG